jgi:hypothetical protein
LACKGTYKWNFSNPKKVPESFFRIYEIPLESTLTGHEKCHLFFCLGALIDISTAMARKNRDTASHFWILKNKILQIQNKYQNPEIIRILALLPW